jgi:hypothetical protein
MTASEGTALFASLLQSYDELIEVAQEELNLLPEKPSSWIPATVLAPLVESSTSSKHGEKDDRSKWSLTLKLKASFLTGNVYSTVIGNTGFTEGVHYWEVGSVHVETPIALGVVFPGDDAQLNIGNMMGILGETHNDLLYNNAVEVRIERNGGYGISGRYVSSNSIPFSRSIKYRLGFLLDFVKSELRLYVFYGPDSSNRPCHEYLVAYLLKGRRYYPAFSLAKDTNFMVDTNPVPPVTIAAYKEKMDNMMNLLRQLRASIETFTDVSEKNMTHYQQLKDR